MANYTYSQLKSEFNARNRNTDNFVYTEAEVDAALKAAINYDPMVFKIGSDDSVTTAAATYSYEPGENFEAITDIKWDYSNNGAETEFPYEWKYVDGLLKFGFDGASILASKPLILYGKIKLTHTDLIPDYLVDYIIHNASANAIDMLMADKTGRFLRNDTTMGELQSARAMHKQEAARIKPMLANRTSLRF